MQMDLYFWRVYRVNDELDELLFRLEETQDKGALMSEE